MVICACLTVHTVFKAYQFCNMQQYPIPFLGINSLPYFKEARFTFQNVNTMSLKWGLEYKIFEEFSDNF